MVSHLGGLSDEFEAFVGLRRHADTIQHAVAEDVRRLRAFLLGGILKQLTDPDTMCAGIAAIRQLLG